MKLFFIFIFFIFSANTFSSCDDDFNNGLSDYNFAAKYFQSGTQNYEEAVRLSRSTNPDIIEICNKLVDSVTGFNVAKNSYSNCSSNFNLAASSCRGDDSVQAGKNRDICIGNESIASDNHTTLRTLLRNTCFRASTHLEYVELATVEAL